MEIIGNLFAGIVRLAIAAVVFVLWIPIGALVWFPLIVKVTFVYAAALLLELILQRTILKPEVDLDRLLKFWPNGFARLVGFVLQGTTGVGSGTLLGDPYDGPVAILADILKVVIMSVVFWTTAIITAHQLGVTQSSALIEAEAFVSRLIGHAQASDPAPSREADCVVDAEMANLRPAANAQARPITQLAHGEPLWLRSDPFVGDDWIAVATQSRQEGFVARSLLSCAHSPP